MIKYYRFSILRLKLEELISEKEILKIIDSKPDKEPVVPSHIVDIDELSDLFSQIHSNFRKKLQTESFFTLWEISKYLSTTLNITFPIEVNSSLFFFYFFLLLIIFLFRFRFLLFFNQSINK